MIKNFISIKKKFHWIIYFLPIALISSKWIIQNSNIISQNSYFAKILSELSKNNIYTMPLKALFLFLPILVIFFLEIFLSKDKFDNFNNTSFGRLNRSGGFLLPDIWYFFLAIITNNIPIISSFLSLGLASVNGNISSRFNNFYMGISLGNSTEYLAIIILIISIIMNEFANYWIHRVSHEVPFLWDFHEFHHSAKEMTILSRDRATPLEGLFITTIFLPITVLNGLLINEYLLKGYFIPVLIYGIYITFSLSATYAAHSSMKIIYPKPFSRIFMSPSLHWLHHSTNPKHFNSNYGQVITLWDKCFGTYLDESYLNEIEGFGIGNTEYNKYNPLYSYLLLPFIRLSRRLSKVIN